VCVAKKCTAEKMASKKRKAPSDKIPPRKKRKQSTKCPNGTRFHPETCGCEKIGKDGKFTKDPWTKPKPRSQTNCADKTEAKKERIEARIKKFVEETEDPVSDPTDSTSSIVTDEQAKPPTRSSLTRRAAVDSFTGSTFIVDDEHEINIPDHKEVPDLSAVPTGAGVSNGSSFERRQAVEIGGETRLLTFPEWKKYKNVFIKRCVKLGLDTAKLTKIKWEVLGSPKNTDRRLDVGRWWLPPKALEGFWEEEVGSTPTPEKSATLSKLLEFKNFTFIGCSPRSWNPCFVSTVQEFIRTEEDANTVLAALHNMSTAGTANGFSRHTLWNKLRDLWMRGKRCVFGEKWKEHWFQKEGLLSDTNLTKKKKQLNNMRSRRKQEDQLDVSLESVLERVKRGKRKFVDDQSGSWADKAVWLALVCGARKIEIIFMSQFRRIAQDDLEIMKDLNKIQPGANVDYWVRQAGLAKKKDGVGIPIITGDTFNIVKPLIGGIQVDEFLEVWRSCRAEFHELVFETTGVEPKFVTRERAGDISKGPIRQAFRREYKEGSKMLQWVTGDTIHFHTLRAIYGNVSHRSFGKSGQNLTVWVGKVLGHDLNDSGTALFYQTINVTERSDLTPEKARSEFTRLNFDLKKTLLDALRTLSSIKTLKETLEVGKETKVVELWSTRDKVWREFRPNRKRGTTGDKLLTSLKEAGVPLKTSNLRLLGYGSKLIGVIHKKYLPDKKKKINGEQTRTSRAKQVDGGTSDQRQSILGV